MYPLTPFKSTNLILVFHSVPSKPLFRNTIKTIQKIYNFISIETIESCCYDNKKINNCCHICFDDGDRTIYENAFPILAEMNVPATLFVSPKVICNESNYWFQELRYIRKYLNDKLLKETICEIVDCDYRQIKKYKILSIFKCMKLVDILKIINTIKEKYSIKVKKKYNITNDQLYELYDSGIFTMGAHTMNHPILHNETYDDAEKEIHDSVKKLSEMLETDIKYFAYPNGITNLDFNLREQLILKKNKIKLAFTTDSNFYNNTTNPFSIPRSGFSGLKIEYFYPYILCKLFLVPIWNNIHDLFLFGKSEIREREEIKNLPFFKVYFYNNSNNFS